MYIDTHCHLNLEQFADDYRETIDRAFTNNVKAIINVGADLKSSKKAIEIAREFEHGIYATVGMHPHDSKEEIFNETDIIELSKNPKVVAVGEIGLDYFGANIDKPAQLELLNKQIKIAQIVSKPIILHCRDAYDDLISALMALPQIPAGVVHCFLGDCAHAQVFLEMGFYLSFTGIITFSKNIELQKVIANTPLNKILIETDAPWLAPEPHRGQRNEPAFVIEVAKKIAEIKKISLSMVETQTTKNAVELFKLDL